MGWVAAQTNATALRIISRCGCRGHRLKSVLLGKIDAAVGVDGLAGDEIGLGEEDGDAGGFLDVAEEA